jgi:hypothetical protein
MKIEGLYLLCRPSVPMGCITPIIARIWRSVSLFAACCSVVACATPLPDNTPALDESRARDVVAVIDVISVRDFERNGCFGYAGQMSDGSTQIICSSPPPFKVWARVVSQLYGPPLPRSISFKTESHWGSRFLSDGNLKLVHLVTDGNVVLMPNGAAANVGFDLGGDLFVPAYPDEISWLPCGTNALKSAVRITTPAHRFVETWQEPFEPSPPEVLDEDRIYFVTVGERRYPRFGIPIDSISRFLADKQPDRGALRCL